MKFVLTPDQMRQADKTAIDNYGIPAIVLMENAARSSAAMITKKLRKLKKQTVLILCGSGNNGGDGFAIARHLREKFCVVVYWLGDSAKMSPETETNFKAAQNCKIQFFHIKNEKEINELDFDFDCIVDAMIGVGGSENLKGLIVPILQKVNGTTGYKVAVDAPSGLNTLNGSAHKDCFRADLTLTMFAIKTGMILNQGMDVCGEIKIADLGAPRMITNELTKSIILGKKSIELFLPERKRVSSKFDYGRVVVIAGSGKYSGAAALCANSALRAGAGLVQLYTPCKHPALMPEVIAYQLKGSDDDCITLDNYEFLLEECQNAGSIVIGPGLGKDAETIETVKRLLGNIPPNIPLLVDADGLLAIDKNSILRPNIIISPHSGEMSRLTGITRREIEANVLDFAQHWAKKLNCIVHLKYVPSITSDGFSSYINPHGNPGMAVGGSGDVLSGIIGAMAAKVTSQLTLAAAMASRIHSIAGDLCVKRYEDQESLLPTDIIKNIKKAFRY